MVRLKCIKHSLAWNTLWFILLTSGVLAQTPTPPRLYLPLLLAHETLLDCSTPEPLGRVIRIPSAPLLIQPAHQVELSAGEVVTFQWQSQDDCLTAARHYTLQIAADPDFQHLLLTVGYLAQPDPFYPQSYYSLQRAEGGDFYWRVSAMEGEQRGPWSETHHLRVVARPPDLTVITQGQGFDTCHAPTVAQLAEWRTHSPYRYVGLYLGGSNHYAPCRLYNEQYQTSAWFKQVAAQGWHFIPIWVGPQSSCSDYAIRMSSDPTVAYQEGVIEADQAINAAQQLGLTGQVDGRTIIYYDLEAYTTIEGCDEAVAAFLNGWITTLQSDGHKAGIYSLARQVNQGYQLGADSLWAAWFIRTDYDPTLTIETVRQQWVEPTHQSNHLLHQYSGGHDETWGDITLNIDSNVADGLVATGALTTTESLRDFEFLSLDWGWMWLGNHLYRTTDGGAEWHTITPAAAGLEAVYFRTPQHGWVVGKGDSQSLWLYSTVDGGSTWESQPLPLEVSLPFQAIHLHMVDEQHGWLIFKRATSINFNRGVAFYTADGGNSWETRSVPLGEAVQFSTLLYGSMSGDSTHQEQYLTVDGGLTWQATSPIKPAETIFWPSGTSQTGQLTPDIAWAYQTGGACQPLCRQWSRFIRTTDGGRSWQSIALPRHD